MAVAKKVVKSARKAVKPKAAKSAKKAMRAKPADVVVEVVETPDDKTRDELGFLMNSDLHRAYEVIRLGGQDRKAVHDALVTCFDGETTTGGNVKPVSTIFNQVLTRARQLGFTVEMGGWRLVPPEEIPDYRKANIKKRTSKKAEPAKAMKKVKKSAKKTVKMKRAKKS